MTVEGRLRGFIQKEFLYGREDVSLDSDLPLIESGIIDSLGIFTLIGFVEEQLGVALEEDDVVVDNFRTVAAVAALVERRRPSLADSTDAL